MIEWSGGTKKVTVEHHVHGSVGVWVDYEIFEPSGTFLIHILSFQVCGGFCSTACMELVWRKSKQECELTDFLLE